MSLMERNLLEADQCVYGDLFLRGTTTPELLRKMSCPRCHKPREPRLCNGSDGDSCRRTLAIRLRAPMPPRCARLKTGNACLASEHEFELLARRRVQSIACHTD